MKFIHYAMLVCAALATGLPDVAQALPPNAAPYLRAATSVLVLIVSVLGTVSRSALTQEVLLSPAPPTPQTPAPSSATVTYTPAAQAAPAPAPADAPASSTTLSAKPEAP